MQFGANCQVVHTIVNNEPVIITAIQDNTDVKWSISGRTSSVSGTLSYCTSSEAMRAIKTMIPQLLSSQQAREIGLQGAVDSEAVYWEA